MSVLFTFLTLSSLLPAVLAGSCCSVIGPNASIFSCHEPPNAGGCSGYYWPGRICNADTVLTGGSCEYAGACCVSGQCVMAQNYRHCRTLGGEFAGWGVTCQNPNLRCSAPILFPSGACCLPGACAIQSWTLCNQTIPASLGTAYNYPYPLVGFWQLGASCPLAACGGCDLSRTRTSIVGNATFGLECINYTRSVCALLGGDFMPQGWCPRPTFLSSATGSCCGEVNGLGFCFENVTQIDCLTNLAPGLAWEQGGRCPSSKCGSCYTFEGCFNTTENTCSLLNLNYAPYPQFRYVPAINCAVPGSAGCCIYESVGGVSLCYTTFLGINGPVDLMANNASACNVLGGLPYADCQAGMCATQTLADRATCCTDFGCLTLTETACTQAGNVGFGQGLTYPNASACLARCNAYTTPTTLPPAPTSAPTTAPSSDASSSSPPTGNATNSDGTTAAGTNSTDPDSGSSDSANSIPQTSVSGAGSNPATSAVPTSAPAPAPGPSPSPATPTTPQASSSGNNPPSSSPASASLLSALALLVLQ